MAKNEKEKIKKIRLSIPLSEDIYRKIETDAEVVGVSMATYAAMIIGNHYKTQQVSLDYAKDSVIEAFRGLLEPILQTKGLNYDEIAKEEQKKAVENTLATMPAIIKKNNEN